MSGLWSLVWMAWGLVNPCILGTHMVNYYFRKAYYLEEFLLCLVLAFPHLILCLTYVLKNLDLFKHIS